MSRSPMRASWQRTLLAITLAIAHVAFAGQWPQFRGPGGLGVSTDAKPPVQFGPTTNLVWKIDFPAGNSSPVIWDDRIFLTASGDKKLSTICIDRRDGKQLWRQDVAVEKLEPTHRLGNPATPTPVTDGRRVYVYFGSLGLVCYDPAGRELWRKEMATPVVEFGNSSSPVLVDDLLILNADQDLGSFLTALDPATGKTVWKRDRAEFRRGFATPFVWRHDGETELVVPGSLWLRGYNPKDGSERWTVSGTSRVACASPVAGDGLLFSSSWNLGGDEGERLSMPSFSEAVTQFDLNHDGHFTQDELPKGPVRDRFTQMDLNKDGIVTGAEWDNMADMFAKAENSLLAIRPGGHGEITKTHLAWKQLKQLPYVSSPLFYDGRLYTIKNGGLASCYDARTGVAHYQGERMGALGDYYASCVAADGRVYATAQNGVVVVLKAGDNFEVLARNELGQQVMATPALINNRIYIRGEKTLWAFGPP
ncbi:MAG TPA: PQQ-binding-like beta-propeller repeat protein [Verrucomicrobiae bacterium]|nr:PQQ-binding-like beta-propeller repeat protein [Verrucomicrobiae bacterium]